MTHICDTIAMLPRTTGSRMPSTRYAIYRNDAKRRGLEFALTREDFDALWGKPCVYCGARIEGIGIDRTDSGRGYTADNVVPCCWLCNTWKSFMTLEEFRTQLRRVYRVMVEGLPPQDDTPTLPSRRKDRMVVDQPYSPVVVRRPPGRPKGAVLRPGAKPGYFRHQGNRGRPPRWGEAQYETALLTTQGHIGRAAALLGCGRRSVERYLRRHPEMRPVLEVRTGRSWLGARGGWSERYTREQIGDALRQSGGNVSEMARLLGCARATVRRYVQRYEQEDAEKERA